ncbi:hypothetical protein KC325_g276 [Hortaea werneckii]|nr:hypothetical protein KC325_g276 [Hortaea werneckii]
MGKTNCENVAMSFLAASRHTCGRSVHLVQSINCGNQQSLYKDVANDVDASYCRPEGSLEANRQLCSFTMNGYDLPDQSNLLGHARRLPRISIHRTGTRRQARQPEKPLI